MSSKDKPADAGHVDVDALEQRLEQSLLDIRRMLAESREESLPMIEEVGEKRAATVH
jgi:hypothetical protein